MYIYDTSLINDTSKNEMIAIMNEYPLWRTNEMGVMNVYFHFSRRVWTPFPTFARNGKYLFEWCELNRSCTQWYDYCAIKYPVTLPRGRTIGIAIPCYNGHIQKLIECLDSINAQTRKPDVVSISCSSTKPDEFPLLRNYGFAIIVSTCTERKNAAENRNIAARRLTTDYISFFDADDNMHPQRIEGIMVAFSEPCDIVLHSFYMDEEVLLPYKRIESFTIRRNMLRQAPSGCLIIYDNASIHHSQVSVRREIYEYSPFAEEKEYEVREDCVFCYRILGMKGIQSAHISNALSKYVKSLTMNEYNKSS